MKRNILITGVSTGIGKSFIELAASTYPDDTIIAFTRKPITYAVSTNVFIYNVDISDLIAVEKLFKKVVRKHGDINILINNAGSGLVGTIEDTPIEQAKSQFDLNVWAVINLIQLVLPGMRNKKSGHIINISSVAAEFDYPTMAYYGASKTLVEKISRILSTELQQWSINISIIAPGTIKTKFGSHMTRFEGAKTSPYKKVYKHWSKNFATMFTRHIVDSDQVAMQIIKTIDNPKAKAFVVMRDRMYTLLHKNSSNEFFTKHILNRYMSSTK